MHSDLAARLCFVQDASSLLTATLVLLVMTACGGGGGSSNTPQTPVITKQPASVNVCNNASTTLSVTATNALSYQWSLNGSPIAGATSASYFIASVIAIDTGSYTVTATNTAGSVTSQAATVQVGTSVTSNPASLSIAQGQTAAFSIAAAGPHLSATSGTLLLLAVQRSCDRRCHHQHLYDPDRGTWFQRLAILRHGDGYLRDRSHQHLGYPHSHSGQCAPTITVQPASQTAAVGSTPAFSVTAVGPGTLTYQWYLIPAGSTTGTAAATAISGATAATYTVPATSTTATNDQDRYYVIVSNSYGQAVSQPATLAIGAGILITAQPVTVYVSAEGRRRSQ